MAFWVLPLRGWHTDQIGASHPLGAKFFQEKTFKALGGGWGIFALNSFSSLMLDLMGQSACKSKRDWKHQWIYSKCKLSLQEWPCELCWTFFFLFKSWCTAQGCWTGIEGGFWSLNPNKFTRSSVYLLLCSRVRNPNDIWRTLWLSEQVFILFYFISFCFLRHIANHYLTILRHV